MSLSANLIELAEKVAQLERINEKGNSSTAELKKQLVAAEGRIAQLEAQLAETEWLEDLCEFVADVRRGVRDLDELFAEVLG